MVTLRVRSRFGTRRLTMDASSSLRQVAVRLSDKHKWSGSHFSTDPKGASTIADDSMTLSDLNLTHDGDFLYLIDAEERGGGGGGDSEDSKNSFRPGTSSLRSRKLHWTLTDMTEFDDQFTFRLTGDKVRTCKEISLDLHESSEFLKFLKLQQRFEEPRVAHLYGRFEEIETAAARAEEGGSLLRRPKTYGDTKKKMSLKDLPPVEEQKVSDKAKHRVVVDAFYEPPQSTDGAGNFEILEDEFEDEVESIAKSLGMQRVGFLFFDPNASTADYTMTGHQILHAGVAALDATEGSFNSPFTIVKAFLGPNGGAPEFTAFQLTEQCLELVAEEALLDMPEHPGHLAVHETFTAIVEAKPADVIGDYFFLIAVPIVSHSVIERESTDIRKLRQSFSSRARRDATESDARACLRGLNETSSASEFLDRLKDFHLLVYLFTQDAFFSTNREALEEVTAQVSEGSLLSDGYRSILFEQYAAAA